jgi:hypothetical protein
LRVGVDKNRQNPTRVQHRHVKIINERHAGLSCPVGEKCTSSSRRLDGYLRSGGEQLLKLHACKLFFSSVKPPM